MLVEEGAAGVVICGRSESNGNAVAAALNAEPGNCKVIYVRADLSEAADCKAVIAAAEKCSPSPLSPAR